MSGHRNVELQLKQESRKRTWCDAQGAFAEFHEILMHQQTSMRRWELSSISYFKSPSFDCRPSRLSDLFPVCILLESEQYW